MIITKRHLSRRTVLKGMGVTVALPFLDAMAPAATALANTAAKGKVRFVAIEMVHGAAGSCNYGRRTNLWSPAAAGTQLRSLADVARAARADARLRDDRQQHRRADGGSVHDAGDRRRSLPRELGVPHPGASQADDGIGPVCRARRSTRFTRAKFGQDTAIPSMQLCIETVDHSGGCEYNYSCAYTDAISWASPNEPLPMLRDPRAVFDALFGVGATPEDRARRRREDQSVLDTIVASIDRLKTQLGAADRARLARLPGRRARDRAAHSERRSVQPQRRDPRAADAPMGVPDSFDEHVKLMFDLQAVALASDITRVFAFKMSRDVSGRVFPQTGVTTGFHNASHHAERPDRILDFAKINKYHVSLVPYFLERLKRTPDGDGNLLDNTLIVYGSPMGNPNVHNHKRCPLFLAGKAGGQLKGGLHIKAPDGTPMANVFVTMAQHAGDDDDAVVRRQHRARSI